MPLNPHIEDNLDFDNLESLCSVSQYQLHRHWVRDWSRTNIKGITLYSLRSNPVQLTNKNYMEFLFIFVNSEDFCRARWILIEKGFKFAEYWKWSSYSERARFKIQTDIFESLLFWTTLIKMFWIRIGSRAWFIFVIEEWVVVWWTPPMLNENC